MLRNRQESTILCLQQRSLCGLPRRNPSRNPSAMGWWGTGKGQKSNAPSVASTEAAGTQEAWPAQVAPVVDPPAFRSRKASFTTSEEVAKINELIKQAASQGTREVVKHRRRSEAEDVLGLNPLFVQEAGSLGAAVRPSNGAEREEREAAAQRKSIEARQINQMIANKERRNSASTAEAPAAAAVRR